MTAEELIAELEFMKNTYGNFNVKLSIDKREDCRGRIRDNGKNISDIKYMNPFSPGGKSQIILSPVNYDKEE